MVQWYNKFRSKDYASVSMHMTERAQGKYYCRLFWDYIDIAIANSFIINQKILEKSAKNRAEKPAETQKAFRRAMAFSFIGRFSWRKKQAYNAHLFKSPEIQYAENHGRCKQCYSQEKKDHKVFINCLDCNVLGCWQAPQLSQILLIFFLVLCLGH